MQKLLTFIKSHKYLLISLLINIILCLCLMSNCKGRDPVTITEYVTKYDTITVTQERIVNKTKLQYINHIDTFYVYNTDTIYLKEFPISYLQYSDTIKVDDAEAMLDIRHSGFAASINHIDLKLKYNKEIQTVVQPPKKWSIGIQSGIGGQYGIVHRQFDVGPYIGIGLQYNFYLK